MPEYLIFANQEWVTEASDEGWQERSRDVRAVVAAAARYWAGRIAVACDWPQEVRIFQPRGWKS